MAKKRSLTLLFVLVGAVCLITGVVTYFLQGETLSWVEGVAEIKSGEIAERPGTGEHSNGPMYEPLITYEYRVSGKTYAASQIAIVSHHYKTAGTASEILKRYAVGSRVPVYYDPADPGRAVLEKGGALTFPLLAGVGGLCLLLLAFFEHRSRRATRPVLDGKVQARLAEQKRAKEEAEQPELAAPAPAPAALINEEDEARKLARKIIEHVADAARENPAILEVARRGFNAQVVEELRWVFQDVREELRL